MGRVVCIAALLLAVCAGVAVAAPPWSAPENVSSPSLFVDAPDVVSSADGRTIASWRWTGAPAAPDAPTGIRMAVREPGAPEFGPEVIGPDFVTPLVTYGRDRVVGLDTRRRSRGRISLRARFGTSKGQFGEPRTISTYADAGSAPSLAGPNGSLVAWIAKSSRGRRIVRAAVKSRGRFRHPFTLRGRGRANDVVAGTALGVSWVAWERSGVVEARVKPAGRRSWSRLQRIGKGARSATTLATVGSGRRGYLAWIARESAESAFVRVAILPVGGARFLKARTILQRCDPSVPCDYDIGPAPADGEVLRLVAVPERDALLAWSEGLGAGWRVAAAATDGGSRFSDSFTVSPPTASAVLGDLAVAPPGSPVSARTAVFVWSRLDAVDELGDRVQARTYSSDNELGPVEDVSDMDRARLPAVTFDFQPHRWTSVWSQRIGPDGPGVPQEQITTFARASTRPG